MDDPDPEWPENDLDSEKSFRKPKLYLRDNPIKYSLDVFSDFSHIGGKKIVKFANFPIFCKMQNY